MGTVVEEQDVPVVEKRRVVLVGYVSWAPFPAELSGGPVDDAHRVGLPETN